MQVYSLPLVLPNAGTNVTEGLRSRRFRNDGRRIDMKIEEEGSSIRSLDEQAFHRRTIAFPFRYMPRRSLRGNDAMFTQSR
jgi:hypothetical protein